MRKKGKILLNPLGDKAVLVQFGQTIERDTHRQVQALAADLQQRPFAGMIEVVPAFTTVAVYYDPLRISYSNVCTLLEARVAHLKDHQAVSSRTIHIPVCYGGEFGPDLSFVAEYHGLSPEEVIEIHASKEYLVYMIGFAPGFAYLGGMSPQIATPRRSQPRLKVPSGSVGIAGMQTGVYPLETPGGWQLIGRTPRQLFRPWENPPSLLKAGDMVRFYPISQAEYYAWKEKG